MTRAVAADGGQDGDLNVNFVAALPWQARSGWVLFHPLSRTGRIEQVAAMVAWIASNEAAFVTARSLSWMAVALPS
ncbi:hypothetical protein [Mesorhizobium sp. M0134]|uniref:hypothetical protein n=1 Tax=Mesorhizobium sp. M0134 TaxID=2956889 RepID=UPI00333536D7